MILTESDDRKHPAAGADQVSLRIELQSRHG